MTGPVRVLVITNMWPYEDDPSYGAFVAAQTESMRLRGVECEVMFVNGRRSAFEYLKAALAVVWLNIGRRRYDLVHAHTGHCGLLARLQWRMPVLISYVGYDVYGDVSRPGRATLRSRTEAMVFRRLALVVRSTITKSAEMHEMLPRAAQPRNAVVPNGVDRALFHEVAREDARRDLRWPFDELVVLFAARRCVLRKRFDVAEEACALLAARGLDVRLRVCEGRPQHEVATWMNASDVLLLPSLAEGSPNVVKEALACNLPVVASDVGDVQELLRGVQPSAVLPVDAGPAEYADALASILATAPMRSNGRMQTAHLEADIVAERVEAIYEQLVEKRRELVAEGARVVA